MNKLDINYLIELLNENKQIYINRQELIIDKLDTLKLDTDCYKSFNTILKYIIIVNNINTDINIIISNINKYICEMPIDLKIKKKYQNSLNFISDDSINILSNYFYINIILYNEKTQVKKLYYYDNYLDRELPFIIIKETNIYELVIDSNRNKYFKFNNKVISELFINIDTYNKQLKYLEIDDKIKLKENIIENKIQLKIISNKFLKLIDNYHFFDFNELIIK